MVKYVSKANVQIYEDGRIVMFAKISDQTFNNLIRLGKGNVNTGIISGTEYVGKNYRILLKSE